MNTINFKTFAAGLLVCLAMVACVQDDDFSVPSSVGSEENERLNDLMDSINSGHITLIEISELKAMYETSAPDPVRIENNIAIKGYVSSSDANGSFYREFFIQNSPDNPTAAIKVIVNQVDVYNRFNKGREVYINLNPQYETNLPTGLYIGEESNRDTQNVITIGGGIQTDDYGTTVTRLSENQINSAVMRSDITHDLTPLTVPIGQISDDHIGIFVHISDVEFEENLAGERYFSPEQLYDTQRTMQSCNGFEYSRFSLETSSFSSFKSVVLPTGNGSISGVVNKTYDASSLVLTINTTDDVQMNDNRCELLDINDFTELLSEDFQDATNNTNLNYAGWTNFAEQGAWVWREKVYSGNGYAEFSTYNSPDNVNIAWLISPGVDLDAQENEFLNFKMAQHHLQSDLNTVEVFISTDYDGSNVLAATWTSVDCNLPNQNNSWYQFIDSGLIDLSAYSGTLYAAFKVTGSGTDQSLDGAFQLDDFTILGQQ